MNKSLEIKTALRNQFKEGTSKMAKRVCYGYLQDENGNLIINNIDEFYEEYNLYSHRILNK